MDKENFMKEFSGVIIEWAKKHENEILNYKSYRWKYKSYEESVNARNNLEKAIRVSRQKNNGGIDLATADKIYLWGFNREFPLRDEYKVKEATNEAFKYLEKGEYYQACKRLMQIPKVGVAGATKLLGLSNQEKLCIYDSRVGYALRDLRKNGVKIILCPPGQKITGDKVPPYIADHIWSKNYEKLIWTLEIIRSYLKGKGYTLRIADIEMALFMMGQQKNPALLFLGGKGNANGNG